MYNASYGGGVVFPPCIFSAVVSVVVWGRKFGYSFHSLAGLFCTVLILLYPCVIIRAFGKYRRLLYKGLFVLYLYK